MSVLTNIVLMCSSLDLIMDDDDKYPGGDPAASFQEALAAAGVKGTLEPHAADGLAGTFNHADRPKIVDCFMATKWEMPEIALLIMRREEGPFLVYSPVCRMELKIGGETTRVSTYGDYI